MMQYFIIQVTANAEFRAQEALVRLGYDAIVPHEKVYRRSRNRRQPGVEMDVPIIPGYALIGGDTFDWLMIKKRPEVIGPLGFGLRPTPLAPDVVEYFRNMQFRPLQNRTLFVKGDHVHIRDKAALNTGVMKIDRIDEKTADVAIQFFNSMRVIKNVPVGDLEQVA